MFVMAVLVAGLFLSSCGLSSPDATPQTQSGPGPFTFGEGRSLHADLYRRASEHIGRQEYEEAEALYRQLIALELDNVNGYIGLGTALALQERYEEARDAYGAALNVDADSAEILIGLGSTTFRLGEHGAAQDFYDRALALDGENLNAHWGMALVLDEIGREEEALAHLQSVIDLAPDSAYATEAERLSGEIRQ